MSSNMYPYNRPTEGGVLNVTENGSVSLAGTNYSEINVNVSGGGGGSVGDLVPVPRALMETPTIGGGVEQANPMLPPYVAVGGKRVFDGQLQYTQNIASGLEVGINNDAGHTLSGYVLTIARSTSTITAMEPWPLESKTIDEHVWATWVMPALASSDTEYQLLGIALSGN